MGEWLRWPESIHLPALLGICLIRSVLHVVCGRLGQEVGKQAYAIAVHLE